MGHLLVTLKKTFRNLYLLAFVNGFLIACLFFFHILSVYEDGLFNSIKSHIDATVSSRDTPDSIFIKSMNDTYALMHPRLNVFQGNTDQLGPEAGIFRSVAVDLNTTDGACGSYAQVLARILRAYNYPVRIPQMTVAGQPSGHILVEANTGTRWVVLDPSYNLYFQRPDGQLASFADVSHDWSYYSRQVPPDYNPDYRYEGVRYTNWSKIPVIMPAVKKILTLCVGAERTNGISLRVLFLHVYDIYFYVVLILETCLLLGTIRLRIRIRRQPTPMQLKPGF